MLQFTCAPKFSSGLFSASSTFKVEILYKKERQTWKMYKKVLEEYVDQNFNKCSRLSYNELWSFSCKESLLVDAMKSLPCFSPVLLCNIHQPLSELPTIEFPVLQLSDSKPQSLIGHVAFGHSIHTSTGQFQPVSVLAAIKQVNWCLICSCSFMIIIKRSDFFYDLFFRNELKINKPLYLVFQLFPLSTEFLPAVSSVEQSFLFFQISMPLWNDNVYNLSYILTNKLKCLRNLCTPPPWCKIGKG